MVRSQPTKNRLGQGMDRRLPPTGHYFPTKPRYHSLPLITYHPRVATNRTSGGTPPCGPSRLPHEKADPHSSRVEYHSTTLSTSRQGLFRRSSTALPRTTYLGSRY